MPAWTRALFLGIEWLWWLTGVGCLVLAALLLKPARLEALEAKLAALPRGLPVLVWGLGPPAAAFAFKVAQLHSHQLMGDSGTILNVVWNAGHGHGLVSSVMGCSYFAVHFSPILALLAPLVRLGESPLPLLAAHAAAAGLLPAAAYALARTLDPTRWVAWGAALLVLSSRFFHDLAGSYLDPSVFAAPFFLWAAVFWRRGRLLPAAGLVILLLATKEQAPFLLLGCGLWLWAEGRGRAGAAVALAAAAVWVGELAVLRAGAAGSAPADYWLLYRDLGSGPGELARTALTRPWRLATALVWPPEKLLAPLRALSAFAFLPLASGAWLLPAAAAWLPQQLAGAGTHFHQLTGQYGSMVAGPLALAAAAGLGSLARRPFRHLAAAWVLAGAGLGFLSSAEFLPVASRLPEVWREEVPAALKQVPAGASVWADEFLLPRLALRRNLKALHLRPEAVFDAGLFVPDRVVYSRSWARRAEPAWRERMFRYLESRGFAPVFEGVDLVVLADPATRGREGGPAEPLRLP